MLDSIRPGEGRRFRWDLDEDGDHHAGLNWYHPHIHGTTSIQVAGGAAGAWIVRGEVDSLPGIAKARERTFVLTTPPVGTDGYQELAEGETCTEDTITFNDFPLLVDRGAKQLNMVNGVHQPRLVMPPGQIERWRFVDASFIDEVFLMLATGEDEDCRSWDVDKAVPLRQIARDGIILNKPPDGDGWPHAPDVFFMASGYRIESILDGSGLKHGDTLCLVAARFLQARDNELTDGPVSPDGVPDPEVLRDSLEEGAVVAIVSVTDDAGEPTETEPPDYEAIARLAPPLTLGGEDGIAKCEQAVAITDPFRAASSPMVCASRQEFHNRTLVAGAPSHHIVHGYFSSELALATSRRPVTPLPVCRTPSNPGITPT